MKSFLENVASRLLSTYGSDLSRVAVVFPNKRASLFLNDHLAHLSGQPIWSPAYITISDLFRSHSRLMVADPIKLVCDLHKSFTACTGIDETLDHFYGWGQLLLSDFDDIDKHLAPADKVLANLRDIRELDDVSYLTAEQREMIQKFFSNFSEDHNSELKRRFLQLWSHIGDIYHDFNDRLAAQGLAYEGALYRQVIADETLTFDYDHYIFVGFNLLHPVEQALIRRLQLQGKAEVIQDSDDDCDKAVAFIAAPTENIQARYVSTWLNEEGRIGDGRKTAIVLCDESLLQAVIHCLPDEVEKVNITTGYPLSQTAIATDILQRVTTIVNRRAKLPTTEEFLQPLIDHVRMHASDNAERQSSLHAEACFRLYTLLNRLLDLVSIGDLAVDIITLQRLLSQLVGSTSIPFHGEPAEGIQVMGVLETRNLDFDHVLLLSCNEGNLPKGINDTSFIPYSIRKAYGLTTIDNKVAIYANYFRRLLQRAKDVTLLYNNSTNDGHTGEMSRFMLQLMVEGRNPISFHTLHAGQKPLLHNPQPVAKSPEVMAILEGRASLSPTALSRYLRCPLSFFYRYVSGLEELEDPDEDLIDNRLFGNIFHKAAQNIYTRLMALHGAQITRRDLEELLKTAIDIERAVDEAVKSELFHLEDPLAPMPPLDGLQLINREVIIRYVRQLIEIDSRLAPFTILGLEKPVATSLPTGGRQLSLGGIIDRLDAITLPDGTTRIRVIDYKTGSRRIKSLADVEAIFQQESLKDHSDYYLQTFLYSHIIATSLPGSRRASAVVSPCLLFIQHAGVSDYDPTLQLDKVPVTDITEVSPEFMDRLSRLVAEIFDPAQPFTPTPDRSRCRTCPYASLCAF